MSEHVVLPEHAGRRLDAWLAQLEPGFSRAQIQRAIDAGDVRVDGKPARSSQRVRAGERVELSHSQPAPARLEAERIALRVVHEDADLIVVDKPAGLVVHPAAGNRSGTLVNALIAHCGASLSGIGGEKRPGIVHRLDRGTSGLMVVAKNDAAHEALAQQFHDRQVDKEYVALVWGEVQPGRRIDSPIGRDPGDRKKMSARAHRSREAVTRIVRTERFGRALTLAAVAIHTGRTHQIRVHLSSIGHPVVGDALYGGVKRRIPGDLRAVARLERPFLHAARLAFKHPIDGRRLEFTSPLPADLVAVLELLREHKRPPQTP